MKITSLIAASGLALNLATAADQKVDCTDFRPSIESSIEKDSSKLLETIEELVSENPDCTCEVVKTSIAASNADAQLVGTIVETAITANPDQAQLISQCAVAVAPDSIRQIQAVMSKFDMNAGESKSSGKYSAKDVDKGGIAPNSASSPLDFPQGPVDGGGNNPIDMDPWFTPPIVPPTVGITPPDVTVTGPTL